MEDMQVKTVIGLFILATVSSSQGLSVGDLYPSNLYHENRGYAPEDFAPDAFEPYLGPSAANSFNTVPKLEDLAEEEGEEGDLLSTLTMQPSNIDLNGQEEDAMDKRTPEQNFYVPLKRQAGLEAGMGLEDDDEGLVEARLEAFDPETVEAIKRMRVSEPIQTIGPKKSNRAEKRSNLWYVPNKKRWTICTPHTMSCSLTPHSCCKGTTCRCNLWGQNCRCQRKGLLSQWLG